MIEFECESCQKKYKVKDDFAGKKARCKECGETMLIPEIEDEVEEYEEVVYDDEGEDDDGYEDHSVATRTAPPALPASATQQQEVTQGSGVDFDYEISQRPDFAIVKVFLPEGNQIFAEPSAMASMTPNAKLKAGFKGGFRQTLGRAFGGESLIINTFTAEDGDAEISFAPGVPGDTTHYRLDGGSLMLQRGAYMLNSEGVEVTGKWQGAKGFFSGEGLVLLKASGEGDLFFNSYGAILEVDVTDSYIVDTGYVVAFEDTLDYRITVLPGLRSGGKLKTFFFGGEGLVCEFSGQGRVWIQTRHVQSFLSWVNGFRPVKSRN